LNRADRRTVLGFAAGAVLVPIVSAVPARAAARFAPPATPMLYTRRLERVLGDGASFIVVRSFAVRFVTQDSGGFRIEGRQVSADVAAPEALEKFAQMERERVETAVFPVTLDAAGRIVGHAEGQGSAQLDAAVREALDRIDRAAFEAGERAAAVRFVEALHQSAGRVLTEPPADLFAPEGVPREEAHEVALPGGGKGAVRVRFAAELDAKTGLMRQATREVVTELGADRRRTLETWRLAPLG
jgi:hypothetical protein